MQTNDKNIIITVAAALVASFFMPWITMFGSINAWDIVFGSAGELLNTSFRYIAVIIPVSGILIIYGAAFNNGDYPVSRQLLFILPILTLIVIAIVIGAKISDSGGSMRGSDFENLIKIFGIGFWLTLIGSIILPFLGEETSIKLTTGNNQIEQSVLTEPEKEHSNSSQNIISPGYVRPQVNINLPKVDWNKMFTTIKIFLLKHKLSLLTGAGVLIVFIVVYNFFIKADPVKDGKNLAKEYCVCAEELNKNNLTMLLSYNSNFDYKKYKSRLDAKNDLNNLLYPNQIKYNDCTQQTDIRYKQRYADYNAKGGQNISIFEQTYNSLIGGCNTSNNSDVLAFQNKIDEKIKTIIDPEPDIEKIKNDLLGRKIIGWNFDYLNEFEKLSINNKTQSNERIEYDITLTLVDQTKKDKHEAQVYAIYLRNEEGWYMSEIVERYITFNHLISTDNWTQITPYSNAGWSAENLFNLVWKTYDWGEEHHTGPGKPSITLPSSTSYLIKSEEGHPVNVKFTYRPNN